MPARIRVTMLTAVLLLALVCGACDRASEVSSPDQPITLELWTLALRPRFTNYMEDLVARYEAANPRVK